MLGSVARDPIGERQASGLPDALNNAKKNRDAGPDRPTKDALMSSTTLQAALYVDRLSVKSTDGTDLLRNISFAVPRGSLTTVVGPSGCGKSTLIRTLAGLIEPNRKATILYSGHPMELLKRELPLAVSYLPQFGVFHPDLTVREVLHYAQKLRLPPSVSIQTRHEWIHRIVSLAGIAPLLDQRFSTLSGGQMRRVALAEELIGDPELLLLDEITTGLDMISDSEIMVWLRDLAHQHGKTIILVTHATEHLELSDFVLLMNHGRMMYFGDYPSAFRHFGVHSVKGLFFSISTADGSAVPVVESQWNANDGGHGEMSPMLQPLRTAPPPNGWLQFPVLLERQFLLFFRDKAQLFIHGLLILVFPLLVAIFATEGLPQAGVLSAGSPATIVQSLERQIGYLSTSAKTSALVSGLVLFQVILLTLSGANNGSREIARERGVLQKEMFSGLSPVAYIAAKFVQLVFLSFFQSLWMAWFVKTVCGFPGDFGWQFLVLFATTLSISSICLAISSATRSPERASLLSIYLVGFQLPLSGAALALPAWLSEISRPFITAYWGWSGYLRSLGDTPYFGLISNSTQTSILPYSFSALTLSLHVILSLAAAIAILERAKRRHK